jgi:uncharacterized membrane protein required for colicin V production
MNYIDIILIIVVLLGFFIGWKLRGIFMIIIPVAFILGIVAANFGYHGLAKLFVKHIADESRRTTISYVIIFLVTSSFIVFAGVFITHFFDFLSLAFIDRILGAAILITALLIPAYLVLDYMSDRNMFHFAVDLKKSMFFPHLKAYITFLLKVPILKQLSVVDKIIK